LLSNNIYFYELEEI